MQEGVSLKTYTTFKIGGLASYFALVRSLEDLVDALSFAERNDLPWFVLGGGSNILMGDAGYRGVVLKMEILGIESRETPDALHLIVGAGEAWDRVVQYAILHGGHGVENLSFIPGTAGGAVVQNIGAYGVEVCRYIEWVEVFNTKDGSVEIKSVAACQFGYRSSLFKEEAGSFLIVLRVGLKFSKYSNPDLSYKDLSEYFKGVARVPTWMEVRCAVGEIRATKFPDLTVMGTAGSYFKNPVVSIDVAHELAARFIGIPIYDVNGKTKKVSLAWILDHVLHMKGVREGNVGTFERQPLVLVNLGDATARELNTFAQKIVHDVFAVTKIVIIPEVVMINV